MVVLHLGILFKKFNNIVVGARRGSPLAVGYGPEENYLRIRLLRSKIYDK